MGKRQFKPGNMLYPVPAVMVSVADKEGNANIITVAWAGTVCTNPPMLTISIRPERYSYHMIRETGEFVVNLTTEELARATDYCGVRSGRDTDKWADMGLTKEKASKVSVPLIRECPVNLECRVVRVDELEAIICFWPRWWRWMWMKPIWMKRTPSTCQRPGPWPTPTGGITAWGNAWEPLDIV